MRSYSRVILAVVACLAGTVPALASAQLSAGNTCAVENAQVSVTFTGMDLDVSVVRSKLDAKIAEVKSLVAEQSFTKNVLQSYNYSISTNNSGSETHFQFNGSLNFSLLPAEKAVDFMALLAKRGYQTSVNVSSYNNNGNCSPHLER
jgi:hypothetical protein